jgi:inorganic pyrophosphatase
MFFMDIPPRAPGGLVYVIIDTPRGSGNKYKYDNARGLFTLSRMLPAGLHFPCDFGSIPGTVADDGDALDVVLLSNSASFAGCLMQAKLIGVIGAVQKDGRRRIRNDRLVAVPVTPVNVPTYGDLAEVTGNQIDDIEQCFVAYNRAQGREFLLMGRRGPAAAERALRRAIKAYRSSQQKRSS